ncbi:TNF receptor-associated factor 3-like isoform X4 [Xenia sp. Carnegie-2017]|uniref:TNF receptor-associated factor 3-like isoform X4 n=1 Tax=Xenia sp. Carnegie-2017 TaxID=2897299 RepID=UPI001F049BCE|nr:TNF receptor-associated factor 3-like isoform X4 [Xenia sp. Carnegie-2017]
MPGTKIRDEDRKNIDPKFFCTYCYLLLVNPMQTKCGHLFCQSCIDIILGSPDSKCPEDEEKLSRNEVFPDAFTKRELNRIKLHCPSEKCQWFGIYEKLENDCEYRNVKCEYCGKDVPHASLKDHMKKVCENAPVVCKYCKKKIPRKILKTMKKRLVMKCQLNVNFKLLDVTMIKL